MNKVISILLIVFGLGLAFAGYNKLENNTASLEIGNLEISAGDKGDSTTAYVMMGLGVLCLIGGAVSVGKK